MYLKRFMCTTSSGGARRTCSVLCASCRAHKGFKTRPTTGCESDTRLQRVARVAKELVGAGEPLDGAELLKAVRDRGVLGDVDAEVEEALVL